MTKWLPSITMRTGTRYMAIADQLATDISSGRLKPGVRLPTHRELAMKLSVTIGTVTRAYAEAKRRGLVSGDVGRGTFVRERLTERFEMVETNSAIENTFIDLSRNLPAIGGPAREMFERHLADIGTTNVASLVADGPTVGKAYHREVGSAWIARRIGRADPAHVAIVAGAQNGLLLAIAALARSGDVVLTESLSFYGIKSAASLLGVRLIGVDIDDHGIVPEALEAACRQHAPKAIYLVPNFQMPTTSVMPFERRELVVAICRRYGVMIVEDDIYGFLDESTVPLTALAPEQCVYITSFSKTIGGGFRIGYMYAPEAIVERAAGAIRATTKATMPLAAELASRLIRSGDALRAAAWQRNTANRRRLMALEMLAGTDAVACPGATQIWLRLSGMWNGDNFAEAARKAGVGVTPASAFAIDRAKGPQGVRIALCTPETDAILARAIEAVAGVLGASRHAAGTEGPALLSA
ncbi:MAG: PLP-dependent aminotransferase family protein [Proteobacteria bacterium]|nr:PLP-dependent aminotransferase family protein [Pseudomonadota bacterium]